MLELVRALAIAWKNLAAYPAGHPALAASMALAHQRLQELLSGSGTATLGVARDGLVCGQEKVTSSHARDLGRALYLREVALLRFEQGVTAAELEALLRSISLDAARSDAPALAGQLSAAGVTHVQVEAVDFSQIRVTDDMAAVAPAPATLWDDLLRAILAGHTLSAEGRRVVDSGAAATPGGLAAILQEAMGAGKGGAEASAPRSAERARLDDRLSQVVGKHFSGVSAERMLAANQIAELVRALPEDIRGALVASALRTLASDESAGEALKVLADSAAPDTILQALRHIKEGVPLSSHALRLLHALSSVSPSLGARQVAAPEPALLAEMSVLFLEDDVDRYNPEDHKQLLTYAALDVPNPPEEVVDAGDRMMSLTDDAVADHMANASIEMLVRLGGRPGTDVLLERLGGLFRDCVSRGRLEAAVTLAEDLKAVGDEHALAPAVQALVDEAIGRLATAESVGAILEALHRRGAHSASLARRLMDALGAAAARGFLVALAEEPDKSRRRRILELLVSLGPVIVRPAVELLGDTRWYVVRNMIILLQRVGDHSALADVRLCAAHPDLRVRLEAIKYLLAHDPDVPRDLLARAIHDRDPKMAEAAVTLAGSYGIKEAVGPLLEIVADWDFFGRRRSIRVKALKALGELADPAALPRLERFFRNWLVPLVALDERRAAYRSLHAYPAEARTTIVERGLRSRDEEIRRICLDLMRVRPVPATASGRA